MSSCSPMFRKVGLILGALLFSHSKDGAELFRRRNSFAASSSSFICLSKPETCDSSHFPRLAPEAFSIFSRIARFDNSLRSCSCHRGGAVENSLRRPVDFVACRCIPCRHPQHLTVKRKLWIAAAMPGVFTTCSGKGDFTSGGSGSGTLQRCTRLPPCRSHLSSPPAFDNFTTDAHNRANHEPAPQCAAGANCSKDGTG